MSHIASQDLSTRLAPNPLLDVDDRQQTKQIEASTPFVAFEYVDVTFGSANTDYDIRTVLRPVNPEEVEYMVVRADRATSIYHDQTGTRRAWGTGYLVLRSSVASAVVRLLLTLKHKD